MDKAKVNMTEFNQLCVSIDLARSQTIFEDMKRLFDSASEGFESKIEH